MPVRVCSQASHEVPSRRACEAQSALTGQRLAALSTLPRLTSIVCSTMPRALETADIIVRELGQAGWPVGSLAEPGDAPVVLKADALLEEGNPIPPSPPLAHGHSAHHYWRDGAWRVSSGCCSPRAILTRHPGTPRPDGGASQARASRRPSGATSIAPT